jgi:Protein of unknown function (DUF1353)
MDTLKEQKNGFTNPLVTRWLTPNEIKNRKLDNGKSYLVLIDDLIYISGGGVRIVIPKGFITDLASSPRIFWGIVPSDDPHYDRAAVLHDYGYVTKGKFGANLTFTKSGVDHLFLEAMRAEGNPEWKSVIMFMAVSLFGQSCYENKNPINQDFDSLN